MKSSMQDMSNAMREMQKHMGQMVGWMNQSQPSSSFSSDTVKNPREDCKAITTRSGKVTQPKETKEQKPSAEIEVEEVILESSGTSQEPAVAQTVEKEA